MGGWLNCLLVGDPSVHIRCGFSSTKRCGRPGGVTHRNPPRQPHPVRFHHAGRQDELPSPSGTPISGQRRGQWGNRCSVTAKPWAVVTVPPKTTKASFASFLVQERMLLLSRFPFASLAITGKNVQCTRP